MNKVQTFDEALADLVEDYRYGATTRDEMISALEMQILGLQENKDDPVL